MPNLIESGFASPFGGYRTQQQDAQAAAAEEDRKRQALLAQQQAVSNRQAQKLGEELSPLIQNVSAQHNANEANLFAQEAHPLVRQANNAHEANLFAQDTQPLVQSVDAQYNKAEAARFASEMQPQIDATAKTAALQDRFNAQQTKFVDTARQNAIDSLGGGVGDALGTAAGAVASIPLPTGQGTGRDNRFQGYVPDGATITNDRPTVGGLAAAFVSPQVSPESLPGHNIPFIGAPLTDIASGFTAPAAGLGALFPGATAAGALGAVAAGTAGNAADMAGAPSLPFASNKTLGETLGAFGGPAAIDAAGNRIAGGIANRMTPELGIATGSPDSVNFVAGAANPRFASEGIAPVAGAAGNPEQELTAAFQQAAPKSVEAWQQQMEQWKAIREERTQNMAVRRDELIAQGMKPNEAIEASTGELAGKMPVLEGAFGVQFTKPQEAFFWDRALTTLQEYEQVNLAKALREVSLTDRNFKPHEWNLIEKVMGRSFRDVAEASQATKEAARIGAFPKGWNPQDKGLGSALMREQPEQPGMSILPPTFEGQSQWTQHIPTWGSGEQVNLGGAPQIPTGHSPTLPGINAPASKAAEVLPPKTPHILDIMADSLGLPRAIMSSGDLSVPRQLEKTIGRHPLITAGAMKAQLAAVNPRSGEAFAVEHLAQLRNEGASAVVGSGDGYVQAIRMPDGSTQNIGLGNLLKDRYMDVPGTPEYATSSIMSRPEFFISKFASKLPIVKQSGRAFATGWNDQMQGVNRYWLQRFTKMNGGALASKQVEQVLNLTDRLLGKGALGKGNWFSEAVKALGFAPGYRVSGPQAWATLLSPTSNNQVRRMAAEELLTWATLGNSILTAAKYGTGASVALELGSTQFGRIKFPGSDTYYNIWGTDNVLARTILQAIAAKKIDTQGNVTKLGNQKGGITGFLTAATDASWQYLRSGEDPIVGLITDLTSGTTYTGDKLKWNLASVKKMVTDRAPMIIGDIADVASTDGPAQALLTAPYAAFGGGVSSYSPTGEQFKAIPQYNTASLDVTRHYLPNAPEPLNLTANEQRDLMDFIGKDGPVQQWKQEQERLHGPAPDGVTMDNIIKKVAQDQGLDPRMTAGALFMYHASGDLGAYNPDWVKFGLTHEADLKDRFPGTFNTHAMDVFRQNALKAGLLQ